MKHICIYEDRVEHLIGVKLTILSLIRFQPQWKLHIFVPNAPQTFINWIKNLNNTYLDTSFRPDLGGWNVKPALLLKFLNEGHSEIFWIDADIILTKPIENIVATIKEDVFVATEEFPWGRKKGTAFRTAQWGLKHSRVIPQTVNSCFIRATKHHTDLLKTWDKLLHKSEYIEEQEKNWKLRPLHMIGDQDVLTALLGSEEFKSVKIYLLKNGRQIAQCFMEDGYTCYHRIINRSTRNLPAMIHAQGGKPWSNKDNKTYLQLSPYSHVAKYYIESSEEKMDWINPNTRLAKLTNILFFKNPSLRGLPFSFYRTNFRRCGQVTMSTIRFVQRLLTKQETH